jgi:excisionase family DNA binding protein
VRDGRLKAYRIGNRLRIPHSEIDRFLRAREVPVGRV